MVYGLHRYPNIREIPKLFIVTTSTFNCLSKTNLKINVIICKQMEGSRVVHFFDSVEFSTTTKYSI